MGKLYLATFSMMAWDHTLATDDTSVTPAITFTSPSTAIAVMRSNVNNELRYATWNAGIWAAFTAVAPNVTTHSSPAIAASGGRADVLFLGDDFKHYYASYNGMWAPTADPVGGAAAQSFGPTPGSVVALGSDTTAVFAGSNGDLYDQTRTGGVWQGANGHNLGNAVSITPSVIALNGGNADLMIAFVRSSDAKLLFTTRTGNMWTAPAVIDNNSFTADRLALSPLPNGGAVVAFRGLNGQIYTSRYSSNPVAWSPPAPLANPNVSTPTAPALAAGVGGKDAELLFINSVDGALYHSRLTSVTWSAPAMVGALGAAFTSVAAASAP